jgi:hypothetical protein
MAKHPANHFNKFWRRKQPASLADPSESIYSDRKYNYSSTTQDDMEVIMTISERSALELILCPSVVASAA